ncbi:MAG: hypothetical protein ACTSRZ_16125 [Promethearchaeota archaeon]
MISKLVVFSKEIELPIELKESEVNSREKLISLIKDLKPSLIEELNDVEWDFRIEGSMVVFYRLGAVFG